MNANKDNKQKIYFISSPSIEFHKGIAAQAEATASLMSYGLELPGIFSTKVALTLFDISMYGTHITPAINTLTNSLVVSGSNMGSSGMINCTNHASKGIKTNEITTTNIYVVGNR